MALRVRRGGEADPVGAAVWWTAATGAPERVAKLVRALVAVDDPVAEPRKPENFEELLGGVDLAREVALFDVEPEEFGGGQDVREVHLTTGLLRVEQRLRPDDDLRTRSRSRNRMSG